MLSVGSLFAGIGGIDLGLERTGGFRTAWFSEIDPFANAVLRKHWPDVPNLGDVTELDGDDIPRVDVLAGGFPCQPVSVAGRGLAQKDPRWLWPQFFRIIGLLRPKYVVVENVPGLVKRGLADVVGDLAEAGYDSEWEIVSAAALGAPHIRERLILVAYAEGARGGVAGEKPQSAGRRDPEGRRACVRPEDGSASNLGTSAGSRGDEPPRVRRIFSSESIDRIIGQRRWAPEPPVGRMGDGVPGRMAQLRALGNAVVPQVAEIVGHLILADARYHELLAEAQHEEGGERPS